MKERAHKGRQSLYLSEVGNNEVLQLIGASHRLSSNPVVFQMIPDLLIGVEFGRVGRKIE